MLIFFQNIYPRTNNLDRNDHARQSAHLSLGSTQLTAIKAVMTPGGQGRHYLEEPWHTLSVPKASCTHFSDLKRETHIVASFGDSFVFPLYFVADVDTSLSTCVTMYCARSLDLPCPNESGCHLHSFLPIGLARLLQIE